MDLANIPDDVEQMMFVVNIFTKGVTFDRVNNAYCRVSDQQGNEMAKYKLREAGGTSGLVIARFFRSGGGQRFGFQALGEVCRGSTWKDSVPDLQQVLRRRPQDMQQLQPGSGAVSSHEAEATTA